MKPLIPLLVAGALLAPIAVRSDELKLKDGTRIVGTIVGFEDSAFKVKTTYGFAVVQKDQVSSISLADAPKPANDKKPDPIPAHQSTQTAVAVKAEPSSAAVPPPESKPAPTAADLTSASAKPEKILAPAQPTLNQAASPQRNSPATSTPLATAKASLNDMAPAIGGAAIGAAPATAPPPPRPTAPEPIREQVVGNLYTNETYGFQMYKPPDWQVVASVPTVMPGAISAMGTEDQATYLLIGEEPAAKSARNVIEATEHRLGSIMDNFRLLGEQNLVVSGESATELRFRGGVDQRDWSGVAVVVSHASLIFTIFGMTRADSDLVQIQENVISRAISSFRFTK